MVIRADKIVLQEDMTPLEAGKWHHVVYQFVPGRAMAIADGKVLIDYKDDQRLPGLDTISLYQFGQPQYDNLRIYIDNSGARPLRAGP